MKKKTGIIVFISAIVIVAVCLLSTLAEQKTIIMEGGNFKIPSVIKTCADTIGEAFDEWGIVYPEHTYKYKIGDKFVTNSMAMEYEVQGEVIRPRSKDYYFVILLNGKRAELEDEIKDYDVITIKEELGRRD